MKIQNVSDREKLPVKKAPYWLKVSKGCYLGFRKSSSTMPGTWLARCQIDTDKREFKALGDFALSPGNERYRMALKEAVAWFDHLGQGGMVKAITVLEACMRYVSHLTEQGKSDAAKDYKRRYADYVGAHKKFAATPVQELTKQQVQAWRKAHAAAPCKTGPKKGQTRSASALNREMATVKAALNHALEDGYATTDVAWRFTLRAVKDATGSRDVYLDRGQRDDLLKQADPSITPFIQAACLLPLRPGAMAKLIAGDFAKNLSTLKVSQDKTAGRTIGLPPSTAAFIAEQCKLKLPTAPIFTDPSGKAWNKDSWKHPLKAAAIAAGLPT